MQDTTFWHLTIERQEIGKGRRIEEKKISKIAGSCDTIESSDPSEWKKSVREDLSHREF